jgi:hypothetical protein
MSELYKRPEALTLLTDEQLQELKEKDYLYIRCKSLCKEWFSNQHG